VRIRSLLVLGVIALVAGSAAGEVVVLQGEVAADSAPYQFIPSTPRGASDTLWAFTDPENAHGFETYLHFELPTEWLCANAEILEAQLYVTYSLDSTSQGSGSNAPATLECREVLGPWAEATLTWTNKPGYDEPVDVVTGITEFGDVVCDVTQLVADWVACERPNDGFALTNPTDRLMGFYSFEAPVDDLVKPALVVTLPEPSTGGALACIAGLGLLARWRRRRTGQGTVRSSGA
jgi:MYXO-CTERM domain-containing protein